MEAIRSMITRIVLTPGETGGMEALLEGDLAQILTICEGAERSNAHLWVAGVLVVFRVSQVSVVAGARCHLLTEHG